MSAPPLAPMLQSSRYLKLPMRFDLALLQQDLRAVQQFEWVEHFNTSAYENGWSCLPLRSVGGSLTNVMPLDGAEYQDTEILACCPYFQKVLREFQCEIGSVRLMALAPGAVIKPHRDSKASLEDGLTRLHVPIQTTPEVLFCIDGEEVHFSAADTWYLNASCEHSVVNASTMPRVHLMLDGVTNPWLEQVFVQTGGVQRPAPVYMDAAIDDGNVREMIALLLAASHPAGLAQAERLQAIAKARGIV
jgi:Aspartyl/Asparaginyl beta-hydroxylase